MGAIEGRLGRLRNTRGPVIYCVKCKGGVYCSPRGRSKNPGHAKELIIANDVTGLDTSEYGEPRNQVLVPRNTTSSSSSRSSRSCIFPHLPRAAVDSHPCALPLTSSCKCSSKPILVISPGLGPTYPHLCIELAFPVVTFSPLPIASSSTHGFATKTNCHGSSTILQAIETYPVFALLSSRLTTPFPFDFF